MNALPTAPFWTALMLLPTASFGGTACAGAATAFDDAASVYMKSGPQAFMERSVQGSAFAVRAGTAEAVARLQQIEEMHGPLQAWSSISLKDLGPRSRYLMASLEYADGPAFTALLYYARKDGTVPISLRLEPDAEKIFSLPALIGRPRAR